MLKGIIKKQSRLFVLVFAVVLSVLVFFNRDKFVHLESYGYLGIFLISILGNATIIFPMPVILTAFIGGGIFNPLLVGLTTALGAGIGELTGYLAGFGGRVAIKKSEKLLRVEKWMDKYGIWALFVLAVIPNPVFDLAGIVAGATKIPVWKFLIVVWLGKLVKFMTISYLGAGSVGFLNKFL